MSDATDESAQSTLEYAGPSSGTGNTPMAELASLLLKILAIYFLIESIPMLESVVFAPKAGIPYPRLGNQYVYPLIAALGYLVPSVLLFVTARKIGPLLVTRGAGGVTGSLLNSIDAQSIAISILGLYLVTNSFPSVLYSCIYILRDTRWAAMDTMVRFRFVFMPVCELVIGLALFLRARGIAAIWHRARRAGLIHPEEQDQRRNLS